MDWSKTVCKGLSAHWWKHSRKASAPQQAMKSLYSPNSPPLLYSLLAQLEAAVCRASLQETSQAPTPRTDTPVSCCSCCCLCGVEE